MSNAPDRGFRLRVQALRVEREHRCTGHEGVRIGCAASLFHYKYLKICSGYLKSYCRVTIPGEDEIGLRRAPRIREDEVRQTADALLLEGGRPTVERVRARLGRGSPNTIAMHLDRWWLHLGARLRDLPGQELPGVPEPVSKALVSLWSSAIDEARSLLRESLATQAAEIEIQR